MMSKEKQGPPLAVEDELANVELLARYFKSASGAVTAIITVLPLSGFLTNALVPVWRGAPFLTFALSFFTMAFLFFALRGASSDQICIWGRRTVVGGTIVFFVYLFLNWSCIFEKDDARVVTGFLPTKAAHERVSQGKADSLARIDLLDSFGYDHAELIWKDVRIIDVLINISFCVGCVGLSSGFFLFVLINVIIDKENAPRSPPSHDAEGTA